jgi:uncharacterized repeat protein (TIGR01451 family)
MGGRRVAAAPARVIGRARGPALQAALLGALLSVLVLAPGSRAVTLPAGFQETIVFSGLTEPTALEFSSDGRVFVAEKSGIVKFFDGLDDPTPTVFADLRTQVHNFWDRGLLGLALHPSFPTNPSVYVLYTHDAAIGGTAPRWGSVGGTSDGCSAGATGDGCVVSGRLSKLTDTGSYPVTATEQVLIEDWCQQYPSHSIGALAFGADGALYVTGGDGASFNWVDYGQAGNPKNPCGDPPGGVGATLTPPTAEGGALRSQDLRTPSDPTSLDGTVLRVSPATGEGLPDNPLASSPDPNARRIIAYGLRNPFRMTVRPGTNEVWLGDVGWSTWEEINRLADPLGTVENFGWPCYEGAGRQGGYDGADLSICENLYAQGTGAVVAPYLPYRHGQAVVSGDGCLTNSGSSTAGVAFYPTLGGPYPSAYNGALFFADYSRRCIWVMFAGANGLPDPATRAPFGSDAAGPVDLEVGPDGNLYYVSLGGTIRRIGYLAANQPPTAVASATPTSGPAPLAVTFSSSGSSDPDGGPLAYAWDLDGDGLFDDSAAAAPTYTYQQPGTYTARLRVTDNQGAQATSAPITIQASNTAPAPTISSPAPTKTWRVGETISFSGSATDQQDGTLPASRLTWHLILHHCWSTSPSDCHEHSLLSWSGEASGSFLAPDHEYPAYLELRLTAVDSHGASTTVTRVLNPQTFVLTFKSSPTGLGIAVGPETGTTQFTRTVIRGSRTSISAITPQTTGSGAIYEFASWSDGGAAAHDITPTKNTTYTATYRMLGADLRITKSGSASGTSVTWNVAVSNLGAMAAENVVITDTLPSGSTFISASAGCTFSPATRVVTCPVGGLAANSSTAITIATTSSAKGWITNTAQVTSSTADPNTANNTASARVRR